MDDLRIQKRLYGTILAEHLSSHRQMALVSGPRQVGKTTSCRQMADLYLNWDNTDDRETILNGPGAIAHSADLDRLRSAIPTILLDEIHKYPRWKQFVKGFFDTYGDQVHLLITGSSHLDVYRRGGDSLMGRYFLYRMHPFTVAEVTTQNLPPVDDILRTPQPIASNDFEALWIHGGYPEPYIKRNLRFSRRWHNLRLQQMLREDIRDLTQIQQLGQLEMLVKLLSDRSAHQLIYSNLASAVRVSVDTIRRWIDTLTGLHFGFLVRPWYRNVARSLRKEPKWFLRDWSTIVDPGDRAETFVACHLLKAVDTWNDLGLGQFHLGYLRDKNKREVDFIVTREDRPWFLVEVKYSDDRISASLGYYQQQLQVAYAFQVVIESEYVDADCFTGDASGKPLIVPARTFLSQLV